jgi:Tfp pilus assembly protein PilF
MLRLLSRFSMAQDTAKAIEFGEMRVELYPESARAYEFLGDVWAAKGEVDKARGYYQQAMARSGENPRIREKIDKLGR